jgi:hypothetical protein
VSGSPNITDDEDPVVKGVLGEEEDEKDVVRDRAGAVMDEEASKDEDFYANLVNDIPDDIRKEMADELLESIKGDIEARKDRDHQYEEGIRRTGLSNDAPGGANFQGASKVVHPGLVVAGLEFGSRVVPEFFPPDGPVKMFVVPGSNDERTRRAERKTRHMNWQLTYQCREFRPIFEAMVFQLPYGGSQYIKIMWNRTENRPIFEFVPVDRVIVPYSSTYFYSSPRITHIQTITRNEFKDRVSSGVYVASNEVIEAEGDESGQLELTFSDEARDKVEGKTRQPAYDKDGLRKVYEINCLWQMPWDDTRRPYIINIDVPTATVLGVFRNWEEDDDDIKRLHSIIEFTFIPWSGGQGIGFPHIIGGMAAAATGALRALLDSAHVNNALTLLKAKGANLTGQDKNANPGEIIEVEGAIGELDVRKLVAPVPFNPPSPVLMDLLGFLTTQMASTVKTSLDNVIIDSNANTPVGTQLSRVEEGLKVFSSIHARIHHSMTMVLQEVHRLNKLNHSDELIKDDVGEVLARASDYMGPADVIPVSDPRIFSDQQRLAQAQVLAARAATFPQLYDLMKVEKRFLNTLQIPDADDLLVQPPLPRRMNSVNENVAMASGGPVIAFPNQHHLAHIQSHLAFYMHPLLGQNPSIAPVVTPAMLTHLNQHILMQYVSEMSDISNASTEVDVTEIMKIADETGDEELLNELDVLFAAASKMAGERLHELLGPIVPILQHMTQVVQSLQVPPPMDPTAVAAKEIEAKERIETARIQSKQEVDKTKIALDSKRHEDDQAIKQASVQIDAMQLMADTNQMNAEAQARLEEIASEERISQDTNDTKVEIARDSNEIKERISDKDRIVDQIQTRGTPTDDAS